MNTAPSTPGPLVQMPWRVLPGYQCFGCSPDNEKGLRLSFTRVADGIECRLLFDRTFESYPGMVHGGIATTVCDEIMGNLLVLRIGASVFTTTLRTRYVYPLSVGVEYRCRAFAEVTSPTTTSYRARAEIVDLDGAMLVSASGTSQPATDQQARSHMSLTDAEAELVEQALRELRTPH